MKKPLMVGLGLIYDKDWNVRKFSRKGAKAYMSRSIPPAMKKLGFVGIVADCGDYFRGNLAAMPVNLITGG
jgi:hypothetical protein